MHDLTGATVRLLADSGHADGTIYSGTAFTTWDTGGQQQGLLDYLNAQSAEVRASPTITLWIHNEADQLIPGMTADLWTSENSAPTRRWCAKRWARGPRRRPT